MLVEIDTDMIVADEMLTQLDITVTSIENFKNLEYLEDFQAKDLQYDLSLLSALRTTYKHFSIPSDWERLDGYQVPCDLIVDDFPELVYDFDDLYAGDGDE